MKKELNLQYFYELFMRHYLLLGVVTLLGMCLSYLVMDLFITPQYRSQAELFVNQKTEQQLIQFSEVQTSIQLINTYRVLIVGDSVMNQAADELGDAYSPGSIREAISIEQPENSQSFYVSAVMPSPEDAQRVVNEVVTAFEEVINQVYGAGEGNIHVLSEASFEPNAISPRLPIYLVGGAVAGMLSCIVLILFFEVMDSTVKDTDFFTEEGLANLGIIYTNVRSKQQILDQNIFASHLLAENIDAISETDTPQSQIKLIYKKEDPETLLEKWSSFLDEDSATSLITLQDFLTEHFDNLLSNNDIEAMLQIYVEARKKTLEARNQ